MSTTQANPLQQLRDIQLPEPISWWPPAPGWWMLLGIVVTIALLAWLGYRWYRHGAVKRAALAELAQIASQTSGQMQLQQLSQLLRRAALASQSRHEVAGLRGSAWLTFLDRFVSDNGFSNGPGAILAHGPYQAKEATFDSSALIDLSHRCIISLFKRRRSHV